MSDLLPAFLENRFVPLPIGTPGFDLPEVSSLQRIDFAELASKGNITVEGNIEPGSNFALLPENFRPILPVRIRLFGSCQNSLLIIGKESKVFGQIRFSGSGHTVIITGSDKASTAQDVEMNGTSNCFFLGRGSSSNGLKSNVIGQNISVCIGEDLLSANNVRIMTSDMHGLMDTKSREIINPAKSVQLDPHVWLAENSTILKGCRMGFGSVLGLSSVLTKDLPARCVAAGVPAKVVREHTTWLAHIDQNPKLLEMLSDLENRTGM